MLSKTEKKLEKARADLKAARTQTRSWRALAAAYRAKAAALETGLAVLEDAEQGWAQSGDAAEVAANVARIVRLARASNKERP